MIKRFWFVSCILLLLPAAAFAQDSRAIWDLTQTITIEDLGIAMSYPDGWLHDGGANGGGVTFAATEEDIVAQTDDERSTAATGYTLNVSHLPVDSVAEVIGDEPTLENVLDFAAKSSQITETEDRVEIPVMGRRTLTLIGADPAGRAGFATVWRQGDRLVILNLDAPEMDMLMEAAYSYGLLMSTIVPLGAEDLSDNDVNLPNSGLKVPYPRAWYPSPDNTGAVFQLKSDLTAESVEGALIIMYEEIAEEIGLGKKATVEDYVDYTIEYYGLGEPRREEFIVNGVPAITLRGTDGSGQFGLVTVSIQSGVPVTLAIIANNEEELDTLEPTWNMILKQIAFAQG